MSMYVMFRQTEEDINPTRNTLWLNHASVPGSKLDHINDNQVLIKL